jgi:GntR family transcriptional repressor for pyruvate dehydrogenase complex
MSDTRPFSQLERSTVSERVRDDIHARIASGELRPGSQLPAERVLADQFGVARTSVREAIQALIALGFIERRGNRSYVVEQLPGAELRATDGRRKAIRSLLEARRVLELTLFELASTRATNRERADTLELARQPAPTSLDEWAIADRAFHASIAAACGNPVLVEIYGRVLETLVQADLESSVLLGIEPGTDPAEAIARAARRHLLMAEAYSSADVERMLAVADEHLGEVERRVSAAARLNRIPPEWRESLGTDRTVGM